jgi:BirA family biotin operon repressor/biotin-[acetyl-CoA-carboxylase] ligase
MTETRFTDIRWFGSIDSTNRYLMDEARAGAPEGVVAVADHQQAGRGRLGRRWEAPPGSNLLMSVLLRPDLSPEQRHLASAVLALAAVDAMVTEVGVTPVIKWPNDLLGRDGRKLAGVLAEADLVGVDLVEAESDGSGPSGPSGPRGSAPIVVGIGINVEWPASDDDLPDHLVGTATSLRQEAGRPVDRNALLHALLAALEPRVAALATEDGRAGQAADLRQRCATIGRRVRVDLAGECFEGTATDVTGEGHLLVDTDDGVRTIVAGDVVHLRPVTGDDRTPGPHPGFTGA